MAVCLWNGGEMKKGQIRTGVVRNVKFPNRAMVVLEPLEGARRNLRGKRCTAGTEDFCHYNKGAERQGRGQIKGNSGKIADRNCRC